jgi:iron complex outermembrane receptor protein
MHVTTRTTPRASRLAVAITAAFIIVALPPAASAHTVPPRDKRVKQLGTVLVRGGLQPTSLPTQLPTTTEGITGEKVRDDINATDAEDALKYLPSLLVRKRYIGDYDHAVLATRASGTGNSARSLVYADGILLSNLLGNGATFAPRWGMVAPEEIERVDVLYGPFSAAYSGNSVGAVVDYVTRMPAQFEAHAKLGYSLEKFNLYAVHDDYVATSASASLGNRWGGLSAWLSLNRLDADAHPIGFATALASTGTTAGSGSATPVTGAITGRSPKEQPWYLLGTTGQTQTLQDQARFKLAYDFTPEVRVSYVLGHWTNDAFRDAATFLADAGGAPVYSGPVLIDGKRYVVAPTAIALQRADLAHRMQGLSLRRASGGRWDYALSASRYDYLRDLVRSPLVALPAAADGGAGRIADSEGTGWTTASAALTWRPGAQHEVDFGLQQDRYDLQTQVSDTADWSVGAPGARFSAFGGRASLRSAYAQDTWRWSPRWTSVLGVRAERWEAHDGYLGNASTTVPFGARSEHTLSPKAALEFAYTDTASVKASIGRAVRFPTVSELYQGSLVAGSIVNNDPLLKPERSVTSELSWVRNYDAGRLRVTYFHERTRDALYSQTNVTVVPNITSIQNVDAIRTQGLELAAERSGLWSPEFDLSGSLTFADSIITENANFPASVGKWQPRVPRWRANLVGTWHPGEHWRATAALRYSGEQFNTLDNSDPNGAAWTGTSTFLVADARLRYARDTHWSAALGVDNLANRTYWNFHPYNQRTWNLEARYDY